MVLLKPLIPGELDRVREKHKPWWEATFSDVMRWSPQLVEKERRIWLNVFGIPLHVREEGVLKLIGERYEAFLDFDEDTICRKRLDFARI